MRLAMEHPDTTKGRWLYGYGLLWAVGSLAVVTLIMAVHFVPERAADLILGLPQSRPSR
jgi:hypothetical protein